jgi:hypothetical protein
MLALTLATMLVIGATEANAPRGFKRAAWQTDYRALKVELEHSYAHLAWFGSPQSGVDLPALDRKTTAALRRAHSDAEASAAIKAFVAGFHDGHFAPTAPPMTAASDIVEPPPADPAPDARAACASYGYGPNTHIQFSLPIESLPKFTLVADGLSDAFRAGVVDVDGVRVGAVRIPRFRPAEFPALCERVWSSLRARHIEPTKEAITADVDAEWLRTLSARLRQLRDQHVAVMLVDLGDNGGGNDLGDWAVRLFTPAPVHSAPMLLVAGPAGVPYFDEQLKGLRTALTANTDLPAPTRAAVLQGIASFEELKLDAQKAPCDMSWVWREQRAWGTSACTNLLDGGFASGILDYAAPDTLDRRAAPALYWASIADTTRGAWEGPTYVYTDGWTGSAAEAFTALMRDRGIAKTIGKRTRGSGCGFADRDEPLVLPHGPLAFRIPNCARLRSDGTDEVAGIAPDYPMVARPGESSRSLAARTLRTIVGDVAHAHSAPAVLSDYGLVFVDVTVNGSAARALIDTGSFLGIQLSGRLADRLHLARTPDAGEAARYRGRRRVERAMADVDIAGFALQGIEIAVSTGDIEAIAAKVGTAFDVILGWQFLSRYRVTIDYNAPRLVFDDRGAAASTAPFVILLPFEIVRGVPVATVGLGDAPIKALLDTGAPTCHLDASHADGATVGSLVDRKLSLGAQEVSLGCRVKDLGPARASLGIDAVLGDNLFRGRTVVFDPVRKLVLLSAPVLARQSESAAKQ